MEEFIAEILPELDTGRMEAILAILERQKSEGKIKSRQEFDREFQRLLEEFKAGEWKKSFVPTIPTLFDPTIKSEDMSRNFNGIYTDLSALFRHISKLGNTVRSHDSVLTSETAKTMDTVRKLLEDAAIYRYLKAYPEFNEVKYNAFSNGRNLSVAKTVARVDPAVAQLTLPIVNSVVITDRRGSNGTKIEVNCLSEDPAIGASRAFEPENAIDSIRDTFWAEVVLADDPVVTEYNSIPYPGVIIEAVITFAHAERFNMLEVSPFGPFPMEIIDVQVSSDGANYTTWGGYAAGQGPTWFTYKHTPVDARYLKVVFLQKNFTYANYLIPQELVDNTKAWEHIIDKTLNYLAETGTVAPEDERERVVDENYNAFIDAERELSDIPVENSSYGTAIPDMPHKQRAQDIVHTMLTDTRKKPNMFVEQLPGNSMERSRKTGYTEVEKLEYVLGAYSIKASYNTYPSSAEFKSPKYGTRGQIINVRLAASEDHEVGLDDDGNSIRLTGIEYDLELDTYKVVPILPYGTTRVSNEFVFIDPSTMTGITRFYPSFSGFDATTATSQASETVYLNGRLLVSGIDYTIDYRGLIQLLGFEMLIGKPIHLVVSYDVGTYSGPMWTTDLDALRRNAGCQDVARIVLDDGTVEVENLFYAQGLAEPLMFKSTDDKGVIDLPFCPYIIREIVNSEDMADPDWFKRDKREAIWYPQRARTPMYINRMWFGAAAGYIIAAAAVAQGIELQLAATPLGVEVSCTTLLFPGPADEEYQVRIGSGLSTAVTVDNLGVNRIVLTRQGLEGTPTYTVAQINANLVGSVVEFHAPAQYEPVRVKIDDNKAKNITDYKNIAQPAFARTSEREVDYEYIQIGRKLYFNRPISKGDIEVDFVYLTAYLQLIANLRGTTLGRNQVTPGIDSYRLSLQTVRL